jgi:CheY-like chemotaxis protein
MADELVGKRIFIVEDDMMNMVVNAAALRRSGATIIQDALNINTVHKLEVQLPIDVILLDLMLRHSMNGYDIFDAILASPLLKDIPVIIVSAADPHIEIPKAKAKGCAGFIGKPIRPYWFADQIASCIRGEAVWYAQDQTLEDV